MRTSALDHEVAVADPLEAVERAAIETNAEYERFDEDEIRLLYSGSACDIQVFVTWRPEIETLLLCTSFDLKIPSNRFDAAAKLVVMVNERLLVGNFDIWSDNGILVHRHSVSLGGGAHFTAPQALQVIDAARDACERFHSAFNFLVWAGKSPRDALDAALFETVGEA